MLSVTILSFHAQFASIFRRIAIWNCQLSILTELWDQPPLSLQTQTCSRDPLTGNNLSRVLAPDPRHRVRHLLKNTLISNHSQLKRTFSIKPMIKRTFTFTTWKNDVCTDTQGGVGMVYECAGGRGGAKIATFDLTLTHSGDYETWKF